jgi:hypothetical protein
MAERDEIAAMQSLLASMRASRSIADQEELFLGTLCGLIDQLEPRFPPGFRERAVETIKRSNG